MEDGDLHGLEGLHPLIQSLKKFHVDGENSCGTEGSKSLQMLAQNEASVLHGLANFVLSGAEVLLARLRMIDLRGP